MIKTLIDKLKMFLNKTKGLVAKIGQTAPANAMRQDGFAKSMVDAGTGAFTDQVTKPGRSQATRRMPARPKYDDVVARLLQQTGGRAIPDPERLRLRSASMRQPFTGTLTGGMVDTMTQASVSCSKGFDLSRGHWLLRVAEMKFHRRGPGNAGPTILYENVIETTTSSPLPTMRIAPTLPETSVNVLGISSPAEDRRQSQVDQEIARVPAGARSWYEVQLPPAYSGALHAYAEDPQQRCGH